MTEKELYEGENADLQRKLDHIMDRLRSIERSRVIERLVIFFLALGLVVTTTGWWLTAQDHSATKKALIVADCRSAALADHLDAFQTIADPERSAIARERAEHVLHTIPSLKVQDAACGRRP